MIFNNLLYFNLELARKFDIETAVLLQFINDRHPPDDPGLLTKYLPIGHSKLAKLLTGLKEQNIIFIKEDRLYLGDLDGLPDTQKTIITDIPKEQKDKIIDPVNDMNIVLRTVTGATNYVPYTRYLRLAKQLVEDGFTTEFIQERYGDKQGYWYTQCPKGKHGTKPNEKDIRDTIHNQTISTYWGGQ